MTMPGLPVVLHQTLLAYAARQRRILVLRGLGETAMAQIIGLAGVAAIDATVHPGHGAHWALSAAAYAAAGQYSDAVKTAQQALQMAEAEPNTARAQEIRKELQIYQTGRPFVPSR